MRCNCEMPPCAAAIAFRRLCHYALIRALRERDRGQGVQRVRVAILIVAAGRGVRAGSDGSVPKQFRDLGGRTLLRRAIDAFAEHSWCGPVQVVIHAGDRLHYEHSAKGSALPLQEPAIGGETRQESVRAGLHALIECDPDLVLIHDASRPLVSREVIARVREALDAHDGAIAALPLADTLKRSGASGMIGGTLAREGLWRAQTPQGFNFARILAAHDAAAAAGRSGFTDDAALAEWAGMAVAVVPGSERNFKITSSEDLEVARSLIEEPAEVMESRTGTGFDVHRFRAGDHVWLCGVRIDHDQGLDGHSDADVGLHALTDALLGAVADGDIGQHFPPGDPRWRGAASARFAQDAARRVAERGGRIVNVDVTLLCEAPRIAPHRAAMRAAIAEAIGVDTGRVSVKATTTEGLGFTGRREGIAAMASATVLLPVRKT